ncbi:hypothetical protein [Micromonospora parathelypteridis]|uniref:Uncharacterized protein n=1 Tax=Micromonospora parathelypteridis TaxID=1839617 RepID=A0A840VYV3_9ACTN|nr:hypothetical protein [Micromonospora parathelypteridis]MBB5476161.1 hypothetical protein [Micromonospora parathelypteridis]GGO13681.1 hypothetical protein GCM10011576_24000 [Micromonospora parathelypteridis]
MTRFRQFWYGEVTTLEGLAQPDDFTAQRQTYLSGVAERRRRMGKY